MDVKTMKRLNYGISKPKAEDMDGLFVIVQTNIRTYPEDR